MKNSILILFLLLLTAPPLTAAETLDGTIPFDCPNMPNAKFQFHFTREIIALAATTTPFNTVDDLYIRIYDYEADVFDKLLRYYDEKLKAAENWHSLQETNNVHLYVLAGTAVQSRRSDNIIAGIFALVKGDENISLLNIVGSVPLQQTNRLLANLGELGIEISELKSLGELVLPKSAETVEPMPLPTLFRVTGNTSTVNGQTTV